MCAGTKLDHQVNDFLLTFHSAVGQAGEQEFVTQGPLTGAFVKVDQVYMGDEANLKSPAHYRMTIFEPVRFGYVNVLSVLSEKRYFSNPTGDGLPGAIATLMPEVSRALKAIQPHGVSAVLHWQWMHECLPTVRTPR